MLIDIIKEIVIILNSTFKLDELLEKILDLCIYYTEATSGSILLVNEEKKYFSLKAFRGEGDPKTLKNFYFKIDEGISGKAYLTEKSVYVENVKKSNIYKPLRPNVKSEIAIPLKYKGRTFGVLCLDSNKESAFSENDIQFFEIVAAIAAQSINNVKIYTALKQSNELSNILIEIGHILTEGFDLPYLFEKVMKLLAKKLDIKIGMLTLLSEDKNELTIEVSWGLTETEKKKGSYKIGEGIVGLVVKNGTTIGVTDIRKDRSFIGKTGFAKRLSHDKQYCFICVPIIINNKILGALGICKEYKSYENYKTTIKFIELIASTIAKSVFIHLLFNKERKKLEEENFHLKTELKNKYKFKNIIAHSNKMKEILKLVSEVANSNATVMIRGESGTGKELIAHAIHFNSPRADKPFIKINCSALPDTLLESELFGYVKGAFTGALKDKPGKFLLANGGTIFLDEIGDTSPLMQAKLLRVLQEKEFEPVGGQETIKVDVRVIAATNKNLEEEVKNGGFREDLYYRLNVVPIFIPPLRERKEDIPFLVEYFIRKYSRENNKKIAGIESIALKLLMEYNWPGNIRELENVIEYAVVVEKGKYISVKSLQIPSLSRIYKANNFVHESNTCLENYFSNISPTIPNKLKVVKDMFEREVIKKALEKFNGNRTQTANYLGITRMALLNKIKKYKLK